jgi:SAM-dependent methyltransferase
MTLQMPRVSPGWLALRETADADARAGELADQVARQLVGGAPLEIHDFGCGTGSMGRWLAPRLPGPQHWIMYDRDADLLEHAAAAMVDRAADGTPVTVEVRHGDVTRLTAADLDGAALVTASALLDLLTADEVDRVAAACAGAGCLALLTLSVIGGVRLTPAEPLDRELRAAFNAHQRRAVGDRMLLGPDAVDVAVDAFHRYGAPTTVRPSPWRFTSRTDAGRTDGGRTDGGRTDGGRNDGGRGEGDLIAEWLAGWLDAAVEQRPELAGPSLAYADRRLAAVAQGRLEVVVEHQDVLAGVLR